MLHRSSVAWCCHTVHVCNTPLSVYACRMIFFSIWTTFFCVFNSFSILCCLSKKGDFFIMFWLLSRRLQLHKKTLIHIHTHPYNAIPNWLIHWTATISYILKWNSLFTLYVRVKKNVFFAGFVLFLKMPSYLFFVFACYSSMRRTIQRQQ